MMKSVSVFALLCLLSLPGFSGLVPKCEAQQRQAPLVYDYYSLAVTSISKSAAEAYKLSDIAQRVKLLMYAATLLPASEHEAAVRLLEVALSDLQEWISQDKATAWQRNTGLTLRNQVLAAYARLDGEKAAALQQEYASEATKKSRDFSAKQDNWFGQLNSRRTRADQPAGIALSLLDTNPDQAVALAARSLQEGVVSSVLSDVVKKLMQSGNRELLNRIENAAGQMLAQNVTVDPFSLPYAAEIVQSDSNMPAPARTAFIGFFMRSLQNASHIISEPGINANYLRAVFTNFTLSVRPVILKYAPEQLLMFEQVLDQVGQFVPAETRSRLQAFQPETFSDPRERLNDILKDAVPAKRDLRLVRLLADLLRNKSTDQNNLDLAADAISGFMDSDAKSAYTDLLTITRIDAFVRQKKFIEAQQLAGSISSEETRAWAWLALSSAAVKSDRVLGFELISNALKALDKASPSPQKVELALRATAMLAKNDPQRAFDTLSTTSRYANSSSAKVDPPTKPPFAFGLEATIAEAHTTLGVFPESLGELEINPALAVLATTDWFRADQIVDVIREPALRLQLKLQFAGAVLVQESKPQRKEAAAKPSARN